MPSDCPSPAQQGVRRVRKSCAHDEMRKTLEEQKHERDLLHARPSLGLTYSDRLMTGFGVSVYEPHELNREET